MGHDDTSRKSSIHVPSSATLSTICSYETIQSGKAKFLTSGRPVSKSSLPSYANVASSHTFYFIKSEDDDSLS